MRILFATASTHLPEQVGGGERSVHTLLQFLGESGHHCEAVVGLAPGHRRKIARGIHRISLGRCLRLSDWRNGYQTHRTLRRWVARLTCQRLIKFRPDTVITQLDRSHEITEAALAQRIRVALMVRDVEFQLRAWPKPHPHLRLISNSNFVAGQLRQQLGRNSDILYPLLRMADYQVENRAQEFITLVNPVPPKGLDLALDLAAMLPHRRFLFVESWRLQPPDRRELQNRLKSFANVSFMPWTPDMKSIYSRTAVLIVPSQWEEAFGRVALEAQVSGIPVIARDVGGLGEVLQPSGVLLAPDATPQVWADEIERLLTDPSHYAARSDAARANAARPEFDPKVQMERFLSLVSS